MNRDEIIEAGAQALFQYGPSTSTTIATRVIDATEPLIRADEREHMAQHGRAFAVSAVAGREAELRAKIEAHFRDYLPPYLFPSTKTDLLPGMETTTVREAIMDVWHAAEEQILELFDRGSDEP